VTYYFDPDLTGPRSDLNKTDDSGQLFGIAVATGRGEQSSLASIPNGQLLTANC